MDINPLPLVSAGNVRSPNWLGKTFSRNFPLESLSDARGNIVLEYDGIEITLFGQVKGYVLENPELFVSRVRAVLRRMFGALDESIPIATTSTDNDERFQRSASTFMLAGLKPWFEDVALERVKMYTVRGSDQIRHGVIANYNWQGVRFNRGYVSLGLVPVYDFDAWAKATLDSYEEYNEADGYPKMRKVVSAAKEVFAKSAALSADFVIMDDVVVSSDTRYYYSARQGDVQPKVLKVHQDLCEGHEYLYAPMIVPIGSDINESADGIYLQSTTSSSTPAVRGKYNEFRTLLAFGVDSEKRFRADRYLHTHHEGRFDIPYDRTEQDPAMLRLFRTLLPDLLVLKDVEPFSDADFKEWHIRQISLKYRDAEGAKRPPEGMNEAAAQKWAADLKAKAKGLRNLVELPKLVGNTLALYSYVAGEAMGDYESWHEDEFLELLDRAFATWQPSKNASAVEAINKWCNALGCPNVKKSRYEFTDQKVF